MSETVTGGRTEAAAPGLYELWVQSGKNGKRYRELLSQHGYLLTPGDDGYDEAMRKQPCCCKAPAGS